MTIEEVNNVIKRVNNKGIYCARIAQICQESYCELCEPYLIRDEV